MPAQKGKSGLFASLGMAGKQSFLKHKGEAPKADEGARLPAGIKGGVLQLRGISWDNVFQKGPYKGKPFFRAHGVVFKPKVHDGVRCEGRQSSVMVELCETKTKEGKVTTLDEKINTVMNYLKLWGVEFAEDVTTDDIDAAIPELIKEGPFIEFRTWRGTATDKYPDPRVNETWGSRVEYDPDTDQVSAGEGDVDNTPPDDAGGDDQQPADEPPSDEPTDDLDALGVAADEGDTDAANRIQELAAEVGWTEEDVGNFSAAWSELAALVANGEGPPSGDASEEWKPDKGAVFSMHLIDPKTKKPAKMATDCEVMSVDENKRTVTLKNSDTGKLIVDLKTKAAIKFSWDDLPH